MQHLLNIVMMLFMHCAAFNTIQPYKHCRLFSQYKNDSNKDSYRDSKTTLLLSSLSASSSDQTSDPSPDPPSPSTPSPSTPSPSTPSPQPTDPGWSKFEQVETYKRRCLILEDALVKKTALAKKYANRASILQEAVKLKKENISGGRDVDINKQRELDAFKEIERRCSFLAGRVSQLEVEKGELREEAGVLGREVEELIREGEEKDKRLKVLNSSGKDASSELRDLEAVLFRIEREYDNARRSWERKEEDLSVTVDEQKMFIKELKLAVAEGGGGLRTSSPVEGDGTRERERLMNRLTIVTDELQQTRSALSDSRKAAAKQAKLLKLVRSEAEKTIDDNDALVDDLMDERRRALREKELEFVRVERLLEVQRAKYEMELLNLRKRLAGGGVAEGAKKALVKIYNVMTPWRRALRGRRRRRSY
ncbi:hypothetical protein TrST_g5700 [Triparma strigata]|uniref:Uncharacterized protein n=3 Tax=Triparma strigata TaxID=1606541 RepID=A0A9W7AXZ0_9STRA|nr:hypothetical protein TrST_g5700 [Triparma strigata]